MATSPLQQTAAVFDESVLKVEFLQMPAQIPDFSLNLNTEALLYRFGMFMQSIIGPVRISGFNLIAGATTIGVSAGLYLYQNFIVRLASTVNIDGSVIGNGVLYVHIAITRMSGDTNPDIVNINPPLSSVSLEGPAQYRYTSSIEVAASLPVSNATDVYFPIANFHWSAPGFIFSNMHPIVTPLGSVDLSQVSLIPNKANSIDVTAQINAAINALVNASPSQLNTLSELAAALGDDANFAATVTASLAGKTAPADIPALVRATVLTGFSLLSNAAVTAADSVLSAIGKLQAQFNAFASFITNFSSTSNVVFGTVSAKNVGHILFEMVTTAPTVDGLAPSIPEWPLDSQAKAQGSFVYKTGMKNFRIYAKMKIVPGGYLDPMGWLNLTIDGAVQSPPGLSTSSTTFVDIVGGSEIDNLGYADGSTHQWYISGNLIGTGGSWTNLCVALES